MALGMLYCPLARRAKRLVGNANPCTRWRCCASLPAGHRLAWLVFRRRNRGRLHGGACILDSRDLEQAAGSVFSPELIHSSAFRF